MTETEARAFLLVGTRTGKLAVVRKDGRPWVALIWFVLDGKRNAVEGELLVRLRMEKLTGETDVAGYG